MKTATIRDLRYDFPRVAAWIAAGEEVAISRHGTVFARMVPAQQAARRADWKTSAAFRRDRTREPVLSAEESRALLADNQGNW